MARNYQESGIHVHDAAIVGGGPGGIGPLVADTRLLRGNVALINPDTRLGSGELGKFQIGSNSKASDFLEGARENPLLQGVLLRRSSKCVASFGERPLPLQIAGKFLGDLGEAVGRSVETSRNGKVIAGRVEKIIYHKGKGTETPPLFITVDGQNKLLSYSHHLVLATGGQEKLHPTLHEYKDTVVFSHDVLTGTSLPFFDEVISTKGKIAIIGGAHSAYSVADVLLKTFGDRLHDGSITIFQKEQPKLFFDLETERVPEWYDIRDGDICKQTLRAHRFGGLRGDARKLAIRILSGDEQRVTSAKIDEQFHERLAATQAIVQATGYTTKEIPIYQRQGTELVRIHLAQDTKRKQIQVDTHSRIQDISGRPIPHLYGIGLGYGIKPTEEIGGERNYTGPLDGVNIYHVLTGKKIAEQILK